MLNGVPPILIFNFEPVELSKISPETFAGLPIIEQFRSSIGIPIPVYFDEAFNFNLTGIFIESESKALDIETKAQPKYEGDTPSVDQRGLDNTVTINMISNKDSIILSVLLALNDMIFSKVVSKGYSVTYLNGSTLIFNGLLNSFNTQTSQDDNLIRVSMQISKANKSPPSKPKPTTLKNVTNTGTIPTPGVQ